MFLYVRYYVYLQKTQIISSNGTKLENDTEQQSQPSGAS